MQTDTLALRVSAIRAEARDVMSIELRDPARKALPAFAPGAHLEITLPPREGEAHGLIRHYSLCNTSTECDRYLVAVGRAENSRGGSVAMHEVVRLGTILTVRPPRNNFPLTATAGHYRFVAGGIGITPILSMIRWCDAHGKSWSLLYCSRNRPRTAFYEELRAFGDRVTFHFDDESRGQHADFERALAEPQDDEHVYCCGPRPLMLAVEAAGMSRPEGSVHFEWFTAKEVAHAPPVATDVFDIVLRSSGLRLQVVPEKSILETLEDNGVSIPFSCREGLCRTCETGLCGGEADHRDLVLTEDERNAQKSVMVCVSRSKTPTLELDL